VTPPVRPLLSAVFSLILAVDISAKPVELPADNLRIDIPDDWVVSANPGKQLSNAVLFAGDAAHTAVVICLYPNQKNPKIDSTFLRDMEAGMMKSEGTAIIHDEPIELEVQHTYVIQMQTSLPHKRTIYAHCYPFAANGKLYVLTVQSFDQAKEATLQPIAKSLRFLTEPASSM
jgi:hypothetical protein